MDAIQIRTYGRLGLLAITVLLLLALIYYREDIFQARLDPGQPFQTYQPPAPPDYQDSYYWMEMPDGNLARDDLPPGGDIFVIVPELYKGGKDWNMSVDRDKHRQRLETIIQPNYVAPFRSAGRVYAPFYRAAAMYTFMTNREDARRAQDFAYQDVRSAFEIFLEHSLPERPIIIAGYGQGGSHAERLLADYFQGPLARRLAAAYVIDHPFPLQYFEGELAAQNPCQTDHDTGCIISWGAFMPADDMIAKRFVSRLKVYIDGSYKPVDSRPLLCTNPLLWNTSGDYAPSRLHKGGVAATQMGTDTKPVPLAKQGGAQCQDGILYVDRPKSRILRRPIRIGGKYRTLPSNLYYQDISENARARIDSLLGGGVLPRRAPKFDQTDFIEIEESPVIPIKD